MSVEIIAQPHPLRSDAYRSSAEVGTTLAALLGDAPDAVHVQVNGELWPRARWHEPLPPGIVNVYAVPQGDTGRLLGMIAIAVAAAYTGGAAAAALGMTTSTGALTAGGMAVSAGVAGAITVAGSLALNALIPPKLPDTPSASSSTIAKSLTGTRNQMNPYGVVPRVYGNPRWYPPLAATPVTEIAGDDQYLRLLLCLGYGPLEIGGHIVGDGYPMLTHAASLPTGTIRIGETDLGQYQDVEWQIGTADQLTLFTQDIHEEAVSAALDLRDRSTGGGSLQSNDNVSATRTTAANTREISLDLVFPAGLYTLTSKGKAERVTVRFKIEYAPAGTNDWTALPGNTAQVVTPPGYHFDPVSGIWYYTDWGLSESSDEYYKITLRRRETVRRNIRWSVPPGQYDVRVTRVSTISSDREGVATDAVWSALRSVRATGQAYTGRHVLMALRIRATDQLNGVVDQLSVRTRSVLRVWDGNDFSLQPTDNPAWHYLDALTGPQLGRPIADSRINLEQLLDWAQWCERQGLTYHWVHDAPETMFERLRVIAAAGQAAFSLQDGLYGVVRDDPQAPLAQVISPRNAIGFSSSRQYRALPHALRVKYIDDSTWQDAERIVYRDGYSAANATIFEDLQTQGVVGADQAWHHGQYFFRQAILRPETYTAEMDWEHLALTRGDRARIAYDSILVGLGWGRVKRLVTDSSGAATAITLDERVLMEHGKSYGLRIRRQDGSQATVRVVAAPAGETDTFELVEPVAGVHVGDLVLFGEHGRESIDAKVIRVEPGPDFTARVTLVDAAADIYDYGQPPAYDPGISRPVSIDQLKPSPPLITALASSGATLVLRADGTFTPGIAVSWAINSRVPVDRIELRYAADESGEWSSEEFAAVQGSARIDAPDGGVRMAVQARARSIYGTWGEWSVSRYVTSVGAEARPGDVQGFALAAVGDTAQLSWEPARDIDVLHGGHVQLYHAPSTTATLGAAVPLARLPGTATTASVPLLSGTYFAVFEDAGGRMSVNATRITTTAPRLIRLNVVETQSQGPVFDGSGSNVAAIDDVLKLDSALFIDDMEPPIDSWGAIDSLGGLSLEGEYAFPAPLDLGAVYTCRLTAALTTETYVADDLLDSRGPVDDWADVDGLVDFTGPSVRVYVRTTNDDPAASPAWSDWQPLTVADYSGRAFQFRLVLSTDSGDHQIAVHHAAITVDMPDRVEAGEDVVVPVEGLAIAFSAPFWARPALGITAEDLGPGERVRVISKTAEGFTVQILDDADNGVARTIDWTAKGYGYREVA